jgi:DHA1 family multidrug resistance protein-like MFS transporter
MLKKKNGRRGIGVILIIVFLQMISVSLTSSALVLFALDLEATIIDINLIRVVTIVIPLLLQLPMGIASDRLGRRPLILVNQITSLLSVVVKSLSQNPMHLIVSSVIQGLGGGLFFPQLLSLIGDLTGVGERSTVINRFYLFSSLGMMIGPGVASILLTRLSLRALFVIETGARLFMAAVVIVWLRRVPDTQSAREPQEGYGENVRKLLGRRNMLTVVEMAGCFTFFRAVVSTYTPIYARNIVGLSDSAIVLFGTFNGAAVFLSRTFLNRFIGRVGHKKLLISMLVVCCLIGFTMHLSHGFAPLAVEMVLMGLTIGVLEPLGSIIVAHTTSRHERGFGNSLNHFMKSLGSISTVVLVSVAAGPSLALVFPLGALLPLFSLGASQILMEPLTDIERED